MRCVRKDPSFAEFMSFTLFAFFMACVVGLLIGVSTKSKFLAWIAADFVYIMLVLVREEVLDDCENLLR